jgi:hypothetical protein
MDVEMWDHRIFDFEVFRHGKMHNPNSIININSIPETDIDMQHNVRRFIMKPTILDLGLAFLLYTAT